MSSVDELFAELTRRRYPSVPQTMAWLEERLANCLRLADENNGDDRKGWVEDAAFFAKAIAIIRVLSGDPVPPPTRH